MGGFVASKFSTGVDWGVVVGGAVFSLCEVEEEDAALPLFNCIREATAKMMHVMTMKTISIKLCTLMPVHD
jgi:hypothetical protein